MVEQHTVNVLVTGSSPVLEANAQIAQLIEQRTCNAKVVSLNLTLGTSNCRLVQSGRTADSYSEGRWFKSNTCIHFKEDYL